MKQTARLFLICLVLVTAMAMLPGRVVAQSPGGDDSPVVFGDNYTLLSGETIKDLLVFGGNASIQEGAIVTGDVLIFGGNLNVSGTINGDITAFGGNVTLSDSAVIKGIINAVGGNRNISPKAQYGGLQNNPTRLPFRIPNVVLTPGISMNLGFGFSVLGAVVFALMLAALAVLVSLFLPNPVDRVAKTIAAEPVVSGGVGLLTLIVAPAIFLVLAITIILSPLALLFLLVFIIAIIYGWIALGLELGKRLAALFHSYWPVPVSAGVGTLLLTLVGNLIVAFTGSWLIALCCLGVPIMVLLTIMGLGAVITSRFGSQPPHAGSTHPAAPAQPAAPVPPAPAPLASDLPAPADLPQAPVIRDIAAPPASGPSDFPPAAPESPDPTPKSE